MTEQPNSTIEEQILAELKKTNKVITLSNGSKLESELARYATTDERKKIWALIDGKRDINELIQSSTLRKTPVYDFLSILEVAGLIERVRGKPPTRTIDFVPASWVELLQSQTTPTLEHTSSMAVQQTEKDTKPSDTNG
jgi:hypothetical protein